MDNPPPIDSSAKADTQPRGWEAPEIRSGRPLPLRPMGIGEILDAAIQLYRTEWKVLAGIVAFVLVPLTFVEFYLTQSLSIQSGSVAQNEVSTAVWATVGIGLLQFLFVQPFLTAAIARAAANVYLGEPATIGATYRFALTRVLSILWISILYFLALVLGFVLLVIPFFLVLVRMTFAPTILVVEGIRGPKALGRSWRLAGGHFWRIAITLILAGLITGIVSAVLTVPSEFLALGLEENGWAVRALANSLAIVLVTPFGSLITVLLYFDLRIRKEGYDIEVMTRELAPAT
jgi:hypothetical protein